MLASLVRFSGICTQTHIKAPSCLVQTGGMLRHDDTTANEVYMHSDVIKQLENGADLVYS